MSDPESIEGLVRALRAEADHLALFLRSPFGTLSSMSPEEQLTKFTSNRRTAVLLLGLKPDLDELRDALDRGDETEREFMRDMRARGLISDN